MNRCFRLLLCVIGIGVPLLLSRSTPLKAQQTFINLAYWPVDDIYRTITAYPDSPWTHELLGIESCPPYFERTYEQSREYWQPDHPAQVGEAWLQASQGNRDVACYRAHEGTDIVVDAGTPVYASADGVVVNTNERISEEERSDAALTIDHVRIVDGIAYNWTARYVHLETPLIVEVDQPVHQGELIGYVANAEDNTHLHFEMQDAWYCEGSCIFSPWGPTYLWLDDNRDGLVDPASAFVPVPSDDAPLEMRRSDSHYLLPYTVRTGRMLVVTVTVEHSHETDLLTIRAQPPEHGRTQHCEVSMEGEHTTVQWQFAPQEAWHNVLITVEGVRINDVIDLTVRQDDSLWQQMCESVR